MGGGKPPPFRERIYVKIFLAIPCHSGEVIAECSISILKNSQRLRDLGHQVYPFYHTRNIYLDRARNLCVKRFLGSDCTELIFIDSDVSFGDDSIEKLLRFDKEIIAGIYPLKQDDMEFPTILNFDNDNNCKEEETGLVRANMLPTGFMRIQRKVFDKLLKSDNPDNLYRIQKDHEGVYTFFNTGILFNGDNTWYGEDVAFCKYWKELNGELFIYPDINFTHTGVKHYKGNLHNYLLGRKCDYVDDKINDCYSPDNWSTKAEVLKLRQLASESENIVEVGCWKGNSTKELLQHCGGTVYAVDHWMGSPNDMTEMLAFNHDIYQCFINNVGTAQNLKILRGASTDVARDFNGTKVDMVFIDADHSYESCKQDIEAWLPKCKKVICGHDYQDGFPGVIKAVNEKFKKVNTVDSLWWVELEE